MELHSKIYVAGHRGLVGSAIVHRLREQGYTNILTRTSQELDLRRQADVEQFFVAEQPEYIFDAAAKVGGIYANNTYRADFLYENLAIQNNVIYSAYRTGAKKLLFLGSSCIYPKFAPQPLREESLLTGLLEPTNEPYAIAKIAGIKLCEALYDQYGFRAISCMPTNLYGPNDNFDVQNSHVMPALIRKFLEAKEQGAASVTAWGTGTPFREFLHSHDAADAMIFLMQHYEGRDFVNIGTGKEISIKDLTELVAEIIGYQGRIDWDTSKPDGTPRKRMDVERLHALGWQHRIGLREGIESVVEWYNAQKLNKEQ
ncbi:MAG: GDP-L-fucose synthase [Candidatus Kapaibacterium sp.]|nr:MAG: GDP-L-fucose synthase [Candidatus Kapabacteria bacterium]